MKYLLLLILAVLPAPLLAQDAGRSIKIRVLCFEMAPGETEMTASGDPTLASKADIPLSRRLGSDQHRLTVVGTKLLLGKPATNADGKPMIEPMAVANIPTTGNQFLILLIPSGTKEGEIYRSLVLSDAPRDFPAGAFRLVNLTPSKLRFAMGDGRVELPPGGIKVVDKIEGLREDGRFTYVAQYQDGEVWNRLSSGYWNQRDRVRSLQIAVLDPITKRIRMRGYDDTLNPAQEPAS